MSKLEENYLLEQGINLFGFEFKFPLEFSDGCEGLLRLITSIVEGINLQGTETYIKTIRLLGRNNQDIYDNLCSAQGFKDFIIKILEENNDAINLSKVDKILGRHSKHWTGSGVFHPFK